MLKCKGCGKEIDPNKLLEDTACPSCHSKVIVFEEHDVYGDFLEWFDRGEKSFILRNGGMHPMLNRTWAKLVDQNHQNLRNFLGGTLIERKVEIQADVGSVSLDEIIDQVTIIKNILPEYLHHNGFAEQVFTESTIRDGTHNAIKVGKHISNYAHVWLRNNFTSSAEIDSKNKAIGQAMSKIGAVFAKKKTCSQTLYVTLSTTAKSFALLGHYGPDEDSCFRQGSDKTNHKYTLGANKDTFVLTIAHLDKKGSIRNVGRLIGFASADFKVFNVFNLYSKKELSEANAIKTLEVFFSELLQSEVLMAENASAIKKYDKEGDIIFHNKYGRWSFLPMNFKPTSEHFFLNATELFKRDACICSLCSDEISTEQALEIDDIIACRECADRLERCVITRIPHIERCMGSIELNNGKVISVYKKIAELYKRCPECRTGHNKDTECCTSCIETNCTECDFCHSVVKDEEITDVGDFCACSKCVGNIDAIGQIAEIQIELENSHVI